MRRLPPPSKKQAASAPAEKHVYLDCLCEECRLVRLRRFRATTTCAHCGRYTEHFMVHNAVWSAANLGREMKIICLHCLSRRLGRKLTRDDFTPAPVNATLHAVFDGCVVP